MSWAQEYPVSDPIILVISPRQYPSDTDPQQLVEKAVHNHFAYKARLNRLQFKRLLREGRIGLGMNCCQVADLLGDAPRTVAYWAERFEEQGLAGLQEGPRSGRPSKLNADQITDLQRVVRGKPSEVGLSGNLWDGKTMSAYLRKKHRVELGPRQCRRLLRQWEFRYRKPRPVIARADPLKQAAHKKTSGPGQG